MSGKESIVQRLATLRERLETGMDRREFLRTTVNAGYAFGMARLLGVDDFLAVDDGSVPIVTALVRSDPDDPQSIEERTTTVPAEWYATVSKAFELHDAIARASITGYLGSAVVPGDHRSGEATISVNVSVEDLGRTRAVLERILGDVAYNVEPIEEIDELDEDRERIDPTFVGDVDEIDDYRVPGGVGCQAEIGMATLTPTLYRPREGRAYFATAHHAYGESDDVRGEQLALPFEDGTQVDLGRVRHGHPVEDVVAVEPTGEYLPDSAIEGSVSERVRGQFTRFGLADLAARDEPLQKVSALTGHTTGDIEGIDAITCLTGDVCRRGQLRWGDEEDMADGDSGSVSYHPDPDAPEEGVLVAGLNNARTWWPGQSYIWGTAAYQLTEQYGYHF